MALAASPEKSHELVSMSHVWHSKRAWRPQAGGLRPRVHRGEESVPVLQTKIGGGKLVP